MNKETQTMKELHEVREKIYEETKHMSPGELVKHLNEEGRKASEYFKSRQRVKM